MDYIYIGAIACFNLAAIAMIIEWRAIDRRHAKLMEVLKNLKEPTWRD